MKKTNNYMAPKAEVIELYMNKDLMFVPDPGTGGGGGITPPSGGGTASGSY